MIEDYSKSKDRAVRALISHLRKCKKGHRFSIPNITDRVRNKHPDISPDSVSRRLRELRQARVINYRVLDRNTSFCELTSPPKIKLARLAA